MVTGFMRSGVPLAVSLSACAAWGQLEADWMRHYDGPTRRMDECYSVAAGPGGTVSVTGRSDGIGSGFDFATVRYDAAGNVLWTARYDGPEGEIDEGWFVGVDDAGNTYVCGVSWGGLRTDGSDWDYVTIKYGPGGEVLWTERYNGPGNWSDLPQAMVVDGAGNVYIAGFSFKEPDPFDRYATHFHVLKYATDGSVAWQHLIDPNPQHFGAGARHIAIDAAGNVYATGLYNSGDGFNNNDDFVTVKVDASGQIVYVEGFNSGGFNEGLDDGKVVTADAAGNAYVSGQTYADDGGNRTWDTTTLKYGPAGELLWVEVFPLERPDGPRDIEVDADGNVYVGGGWDAPLDGDGLLLSYGPGGALRWSQIYDGESFFDEQGVWGVEIASDGTVCVLLDWQYDDDAGYDVTLIRHAPDGSLLEQSRFDSGSTSDLTWDLEIDGNDTLYVAAQSAFQLTSWDYTVVKVPTRDACIADFNGDGAVNTQDVLAFLNAWNSGDPRADINGDGAINTQDVLAYLNLWNTGC